METRTYDNSKILAFSICLLNLALFFSGCTAFQVSGDVQRGRYALMAGDSKSALGYFQRAAEVDPGYAAKIGPVKWESVSFKSWRSTDSCQRDSARTHRIE